LNDQQFQHEMKKAAFDQNQASFRALNQQMWQIPLISMTLTGGLWFGVSRVEDFPLFQLALLFLAFAGNAALFVIILRLRFVMEQYLNWLETNHEEGFVSAKGENWYSKPFVVRTAFQGMLLLAALLSLMLLVVTCWTNREEVFGIMPMDPALSYYEDHAASLADGYEALTLESAHPALLPLMEGRFEGHAISVLDVGAGTGRDAAWFAASGHRVVAVEPSAAMQQIARRLHAGAEISWLDDALPNLPIVSASGDSFDLIILSAVWMHVKPDDRQRALQTLLSLLKPAGVIYITLRVGPPEPVRGIYPVSEAEVISIANALGLHAAKLDEQTDLLGRSNIRWISMEISAP
jgi:SAM-dependent methyltransferase